MTKKKNAATRAGRSEKASAERATAPAFTAGPWGIEQTATDWYVGPLRADGKVAFIVSDHDVCNALTPSARRRNKANARLMAAAPELFAVVQAIARYGLPHLNDECRRLIAKVLQG